MFKKAEKQGKKAKTIVNIENAEQQKAKLVLPFTKNLAEICKMKSTIENFMKLVDGFQQPVSDTDAPVPQQKTDEKNSDKMFDVVEKKENKIEFEKSVGKQCFSTALAALFC
jgi:hypothetical protein